MTARPASQHKNPGGDPEWDLEAEVQRVDHMTDGRLSRRPGEVTATELYFHTDDLIAGIAKLGAAGARELSPLALRDWGDEAAYFADPEGNVIVLARAARDAG